MASGVRCLSIYVGQHTSLPRQRRKRTHSNLTHRIASVLGDASSWSGETPHRQRRSTHSDPARVRTVREI